MKRALIIFLFLAGCASVTMLDSPLTQQFGPVAMTERQVDDEHTAAQFYQRDVQPILENRCVVCHGCYDAPCQLKLSSPAGIMRGASKEKVYDGTRILAAAPTRLGIDAQNTQQWRDKGFHTVLNERTQTPDVNLANSPFYQMLAQKQNHPLPKKAILSKQFPLGLDRPEFCPSPEEMPNYLQEHPLWGMPYALPALNKDEHNTLTKWVAQGAIMGLPPELPKSIRTQVDVWEQFLNQDSLKAQLASRYIYEHTYLASLYFDDTPLFKGQEPAQPVKFYFRLVRSSTPPGLPIHPIASRRPYDDPGVKRVYYRLVQKHESIVAKTHMPYRLNQERINWMKALFITPDYVVSTLPGYHTEIAANPFLAFKDLPIASRYRFMLEEAQFIIQGFIKGPVCRGQVALNVIDDHFWVAFVDPEFQDDPAFNDFLIQQSDYLRLPGEDASNAVAVNWLKYALLHESFLKAKNKAIRDQLLSKTSLDLNLIWDGDGQNPNVALTIFRHFDSSTVVQGWAGQKPKTTWLISYPLLERIHYLLVAEFDVYGNIGHQLMTRLYMDFLRMEGEANFISLLPQKERVRLTQHWYRDASDAVKEHLLHTEEMTLAEPTIPYVTDQPYHELLDKMDNLMSPAMHPQFRLNTSNTLQKNIAAINSLKGKPATLMPEISILRVKGKQDQLFTIIRNTGHSNITGLLYEEGNLLPEEDYLTVLPGVAGSYPGAYFDVHARELTAFIEQLKSVNNEASYAKLKDSFGIRRTHEQFWSFSDEVHEWYKIHQPMDYGLLDYNRLENR